MSTDARIPRLERLDKYSTGLNDPYYLHYKFLFADIKYAIKKYTKGRVLDMGCGNKPYKDLFGGLTSSYIGCDIVQSSGDEVDILCPCTAVTLPDGSVETVFTTQVLEHVAEHGKMLAEAFRLLTPGGYIILTAPMYWEHHEEPYDFFRFTKYGMQHLFETAGFEIVEIKPNGGKWALTGQALLNNLRSTLYRRNSSIKRKIFKTIFIILRLKWLINLFFAALEKWDTDYKVTLNYLVVARRPATIK
jgi:SAM-dependent methyltransferase